MFVNCVGVIASKGKTMSESVNERWVRWDKLASNEKHEEIVLEFDRMLKKKEKITVGDLVRRDNALESIGVISLSPSVLEKKGYGKRR